MIINSSINKMSSSRSIASSLPSRSLSTLTKTTKTMTIRKVPLLLFLLQISIPITFGKSSVVVGGRYPGTRHRLRPSDETQPSAVLTCRRGGGDDNEIETTTKIDDDDDDDERYSRQVYALGARAHKIVRSGTVVFDGALDSGLLFECGKNVALSGVGRVVLVVPDEEEEEEEDWYARGALDDLGRVYRNAARGDGEVVIGYKEDVRLLTSFLRELNPHMSVEVISRRRWMEMMDERDTTTQTSSAMVMVCVDRGVQWQIENNRRCRQWGIPFVSVESAGVYGRAFSDFGEGFEVVDDDGEDPKWTLIESMKEDEETTRGIARIWIPDGEKHDVSAGDTVELETDVAGDDRVDVDGDTGRIRVTVSKVHSPSSFSVKMKDCGVSATSFVRVKIPRKMNFMSLEQCLAECQTGHDGSQLFALCDLEKTFDVTRRQALMASFQALDAFTTKYHKLPYRSSDTDDDVETFMACALATPFAPSDDGDVVAEESWKDIVRCFGKTARGRLAPVQAFFGAIGAQEALKGMTGLYNPLVQFLLFDCDELLLSSSSSNAETTTSETTTTLTGQSYILGHDTSHALSQQSLFIVGAGAIGCELLKNLAAMGAGTGSRGRLIVTDMDTIEKSNLSRQLLFRETDVGSFKSIAAANAIRRFDPRITVETHTQKVGEETTGDGETPSAFSPSFWRRDVSAVLNALDNVEARLYMDSQCVANHVCMIDAGTLGSKGNVQVVVPDKTESYGSSQDPPPEAIPVCTLKHFPYDIEHTVTWGRDLLEGLFANRISQLQDHYHQLSQLGTNKKNYGAHLLNTLGEEAACQLLKELQEDLTLIVQLQNQSPLQNLQQEALSWAMDLAEQLFSQSIKQLLRQHPPDSLDDDDKPFWSGTRRLPRDVTFQHDTEDPTKVAINQYIVSFVQTAARLRIEAFRPLIHDDNESSSSIISSDQVVNAYKTPKDNTETPVTSDNSNDDNLLSRLLAQLPSSLPPLTIFPTPLEFEKDDDSNGHIDFITAASNLRALNYNIPPTTAMETRRIAGKIIPAMITTTAIVSALSTLELLKTIQNAPLSHHRNAFVNLALPFFAFTRPLPPETHVTVGGLTYTLWDKLEIRETKRMFEKGGGVTLRRFLKLIKRHYKKRNVATDDDDGLSTVVTVSHGPYMIYANFLHEGDEELLSRRLWDVIAEAIVKGDDEEDDLMADGDMSEDDEESGDATTTASMTQEQMKRYQNIQQRQSFRLELVVEDGEGNEVELPPVVVIKYEEDC